MSAYGVGADVSTKSTTNELQSAPDKGSVPETLVKWIPGEAITFYAAILGIGATQGDLTGKETPEELLQRIDAGSPGWFATGAVIAVALVVVGALTASRPAGAKGVSVLSLFIRVVLTVVAFVIW